MVQRNLISSAMQEANVQNTWQNAAVYKTAANIMADSGQKLASYADQQEEAAFQRLDLEAQKLQNEQLNNMKLADSAEMIPNLKAEFEQKLNSQFAQDNWGQRWLKKRGQNFLAANNIDVQRVTESKQEELTVLETNKTLQAFADEIAVSAPDKAQSLITQANMLVDTRSFLTPEQKQSTKDNFTKLWVGGMVTHNTDKAINLLSDNSRLTNLTEIERKDYLLKAQELKLAKEKEVEKQNKLKNDTLKLQNSQKIAELKVGLLTGKKTINDIEQAKAAGIFDLEPSEYLNSYQLITKENKQISNPEVLADVKSKIISGKISKDEIVDLRLQDILNESDTNELIQLYDKKYPAVKTDKKQEEKDSADFKQLVAQIDSGAISAEEQINELFKSEDNPISQKVWTDARAYLEKKKNKNLNDTKAENEISDIKNLKRIMQAIDDGTINSREQINDLYYNSDTPISKDVWEDAVKYFNDAQKNVDGQKKDQQLQQYLGDIAEVDNGNLTEFKILQNVADGRYDESHGDKLIERLKKKQAAEGKLSDGQKATMALSLYTDLENLYSKASGIEDFSAFNRKITDYMNLGIISKSDGEKILQSFSISYMNKYEEMLQQFGDNPWLFGDNTGYFAIKDWIDDVYGQDPKMPKAKDGVEKHNAYNAAMGKRAASKIAIWKIYTEALAKMAQSSGLQNVGDILSQDTPTRTNIYNAAVELTKQTWAKGRYKTLANANPTAVLSEKDGLISTGGNDTGGKPLKEERILQVGYNKKSGTYMAKFANGVIKEIDYETYKQYGGKK